MSTATPDTSIHGLNSLTASAINLLRQLEAVLLQINDNKDPSKQVHEEPASSASTASVDALSLARDSATLIRAHATKISVLIINEPFTPSAIIKVLRELIGSAIPGLAAAAQACTANRYTLTVRRDLAWKAYVSLKELRGLIERIPTDGNILSEHLKQHGSEAAGTSKGSMAATGTLWAACDEVIRFSKAGIGGCFVTKVEEFRDTLKDVMEELKEWGDETPDDEDDDNEYGNDAADDADRDSGLGSMMPSTQDIVDEIMTSGQAIPRDDPDRIRDRLESCLKKIRLTTLLYQAIIRRRLKVLPPLPKEGSSDVTDRLDQMVKSLKSISHQFDELAGAFYDLDSGEIDRRSGPCFSDICALSELLQKPWDKDSDEFTEWADKFRTQINKVERPS